MRRKLVKQGNNALTVTLPKKWLDGRGLKPGDEINVVELNSNLLLSAEVVGKKEYVLTLTGETYRYLRLKLTHLYRRKFDKIEIKNIDFETIQKISRTCQDSLFGFDIVAQNETSCTIENIGEPEDSKYDAVLRKVFLLIKETYLLIKNDLSSGKYVSENIIQEHRNRHDKYVYLCKRILYSEFSNRKHTLEWELLTFLMHIQHALYYLYEVAKNNKIKMSEQTTVLFSDLVLYFDLLYDAFYQKDVKKIHEIDLLKDKYQYGSCYKLLKQAKGNEVLLLAHIRELFRLIQISTSPIMALILEEVWLLHNYFYEVNIKNRRT